VTESDFTRKLLKALRARMPGAVIIKHCNPLTAGVPDFSVTHEGVTTWCEVKLTTNRRIFQPLQLEMLRRLRGYYLIWSPPLRQGYLFRADEIRPLEAWINETPYTFDELVEQIVRTF
jgi:hypothetical protein